MSDTQDSPATPAHGVPTRPQSRLIATVIILIVAVITASLAWVVSAPVGSSPDEDFHVGAMWCPPPIEDSGCQITLKDGKKAVVVPQTLAKENVTCYAFEHNNSARCTFAASDDLTAPTLRWDDGNYPWGYYQFAHLFVQHSTNRAVLSLRIFNALLAITLLGAIIALADSGLRRAISVALVVAWLPMGFCFVAGINPSSWALTGTFAFAAGLFAATRTVGSRRIGLIVCAVVGAILACTSRGDSAFYIFVVTVALAFAVRPNKRIIPEAVVACVASTVGILVMLHTNASSNLASVEPSATTPGRRVILMENLEAIPNYLAGFAGYRMGPGWNDVSYAGTVTGAALTIVGVIICWALVSLTWRRALSALVVLGAIVGVPVVIGVQGRFSNVFLLMLLAPSPASPGNHGHAVGTMPFHLPSGRFGRLCAGLVAALWALTHGRALYLIIERYAFGRTPHSYPLDLSTRNLSAGFEWWWPTAPIGPMAVWVIGALAGVIAIGVALHLWQRSPEKMPEPRR